MKTFSTFAVFGLLLLTSQALAVQHFTCWNLPLDAHSNDRVIIALKSATEGTLFLTSGLNDEGNQDSTGPLKMDKSAEGTWVAKNESSIFTVAIPDSCIGKNSDDLVLDLDLANAGAHSAVQLGCYTRVYE